MKWPSGQVELRAILVPIVASVVTSGITGAATFTVAKGQAAAAYEHRQADQQAAIDRLNQRDFERQAENAQIQTSVQALREETAGSVKRIEASFNALLRTLRMDVRTAGGKRP